MNQIDVCIETKCITSIINLSHIPAAAVTLGDSLTVLDLNDLAKVIFTRTGISIIDNILNLDFESERSVLAGIEAVRRGKQKVQLKIYFKSPADENICFDIRMTPHPNSTEERPVATALFIDISHYYKEITNFESMNHTLVTKLEQREEELEARRDQLIKLNAMESTGLLVGGLNHDICNMMAVIKSSVELLQNMAKDKSTNFKAQKEYLVLIGKAVEKTMLMNDMFLKQAKPTQLEFKPFDLTDIVRNVARICACTMPKSIRVRECYEEPTAYVMGNRHEIEQAILNLCINASHAMTVMRGDEENYGGKLGLSIEPYTPTADFSLLNPDLLDTEYWKLEITDTGVGMDEATIKKIYEPLFTTKGDGIGTGIGLTIVSEIVEHHRGVINVESVPGEGTSFIVYVPFMMI